MSCTDQQIRKYMKHRIVASQELAAAKAGIDPQTGRKYERLGKLPSELHKSRHWLTRKDAFESVWPELKAMLDNACGLEAKTLLEWLIEREPGKYNWSQLRTLQRRVAGWRILHGPDKEVMFPQTLHPGIQSQSDYTHMKSLGILIDGEPFDHLLFHFILPYSQWESINVCYSESFESLVEGFESAVWKLGGLAKEHRTDNLSAATQAMGSQRKFTERWSEVLSHYRVKPSRNNPGASHENGSIEKSHDLFKRAVAQQLMLRGSHDFSALAEYESFLEQIRQYRQRGKEQKIREELKELKELPSKPWNAPKLLWITVSPFSTIKVKKELYSVPSRLIGQQLKALVYPKKVELYYGSVLAHQFPRGTSSPVVSINYRHLVHHLLRKPGAFVNYQYRDCLFPQLSFRKAWDCLLAEEPTQAPKTYLKILQLAAIGNENEISLALELLLENQQVPTVESVESFLENKNPEIPQVEVMEAELSGYDSLLSEPQEVL